MIVETVRLSEKAKNQLIQIKRKTGIEHWNVLCRWALMLSLREPSPPPMEKIVTDSMVEITWKTFSGPLDSAISALVLFRYHQEKEKAMHLDVEDHFKLHIHRGISILSIRNDLDLAAMLRLT